MAKKPLRNDPTKAGAPAAKKRLFGDFSRFAVYPVHTRFDDVEWFVTDADQTCPITGMAAVIRQEPTEAEAVAGLE